MRFICSIPVTAGMILLVLPTILFAAAVDRPNIVLCMADDQGWGDVGYRNHSVLKTPTLDEMARDCLRLERFYAAAPVCSPTRGSVLTGRHPNRFGCFSWGHSLRPQEITIAEALKTGRLCHGALRQVACWTRPRRQPCLSGAQRLRRVVLQPQLLRQRSLDESQWQGRRDQGRELIGDGKRGDPVHP